MKAGIYRRRDNNKLIYVAKDRSIRAFERADHVRALQTDIRVRTSVREQVVSFVIDGHTVVADRAADVPNGCTDPAGALRRYRDAQAPDFTQEATQLLVQSAATVMHVYRWAARAEEAAKLGIVTIVDDEIIINDADAWTAFQNYAATDNQLASHAPAEQKGLDDADVDRIEAWASRQPADARTMEERAAEQLSVAIDYSKAQKDLQLMLHAEELGIIQWVGNDWEIFDIVKWNELHLDPPKLLPVLPRWWVESRRAHYAGAWPTKNPVVSTRGDDRAQWEDDAALDTHVRGCLAIAVSEGSIQWVGGAWTITDQARVDDLFGPAITMPSGKRGGVDVRPTSVGEIMGRYFPGLDARYATQSQIRCGVLSFETTDAACASEEQAKRLAEKYRDAKWVPRPSPVNFRPSELPRWAGCPDNNVKQQYRQNYIETGKVRLIGKQSARKHRRMGHRVFWCAPLQSWAWEPR